MSERSANGRPVRYGVPPCAHARDSVDRLLLDWARERPDLDFTPVGIVTRLARIRTRIDAELSALFARYGLTGADFTVIVVLRRVGEPYALPQARLMEALGLTSGTVSVRLDRLERNGIVTREADPQSARASVVRLTQSGLDLFDQVAPAHLANEDRLLSALTDAERRTLADLLRRLLADFEASPPQPLAAIGIRLEPAHVARTRRTAVGLGDEPGLLVAEVTPGSPADAAGARRGDLLVQLSSQPVAGTVGLALLLDELRQQRSVTAVLVRGTHTHRVRLPVPGSVRPPA